MKKYEAILTVVDGTRDGEVSGGGFERWKGLWATVGGISGFFEQLSFALLFCWLRALIFSGNDADV